MKCAVIFSDGSDVLLVCNPDKISFVRHICNEFKVEVHYYDNSPNNILNFENKDDSLEFFKQVSNGLMKG